MEWIVGIALALGVIFALLALFALKAKRRDPGNIPGRFDFDRYKEGELSRRGLFDKTKWQ